MDRTNSMLEDITSVLEDITFGLGGITLCLKILRV